MFRFPSFPICLTTILILIASHFAAAIAQKSDDDFRTWTAENGKFSINAKLLSCGEELIRLETKDGKILKVDLERLCDADKAFIKEVVESEENPFADTESENPFTNEEALDDEPMDEDPPNDLGTRDDELFSGLGGSKSYKRRRSSSKSESKPVFRLPPTFSLKFGRRNLRLKSDEFAVEIASAEELTFERDTIQCDMPTSQKHDAFHDRLGNWTISFNENYLAASITNPFRKQGWLTVYNLANGTVTKPVAIPWERTKLLTISNDGKTLLTTNDDPGTPSRCDQWSIADSKLDHVRGWKTKAFHDRGGVKLDCAVMLDDQRIFSAGSEVALWDAESGVDEYTSTAKMVGIETGMVLSPDRKSFAAVANGRIHILNILSGEVEGILAQPDDPISNTNWQEMAFSPSGAAFAARRGNELTIWNLKNGDVSDQFPVLTSGGLSWVDDQHILIGGLLHNIDLRAVVWRYRVAYRNLVPLSDGRLLFVDKNGVSVIQLPHAELADRVKMLNEDDLLVLQDGDIVGLDFSGLESIEPDTKKEIEKLWTEKLENAGAKVRVGGDFERVIRFKVIVAKETKRRIRNMMQPFPMAGPFGPFGGPFGSPSARGSEEIKYNEKTAIIELLVDEQVLWRTSKHFGPSPIIMHTRNDETPQQHVTRVSKVDESFFTTRFIPEGLCAIPSELIGESKVTRFGIE